MKDSLGQPLAEEDVVAYIAPYYKELCYGTIKTFTPLQVRIMPFKPDAYGDQKKKGMLRYPDAVLKVTEQYKTFATEHPELFL